MSDLDSTGTNQPPTPSVRVPYRRTVVAALIGAVAGVVIYFLLKSYTGAFARYESTSMAGLLVVLSWTPVFFFGLEQLRRTTYLQVLPINALLGFLSVAVVLGGEYLAWWLAGKALLWDELQMFVLFVAALPLAMGPFLWKYLVIASRN